MQPQPGPAGSYGYPQAAWGYPPPGLYMPMQMPVGQEALHPTAWPQGYPPPLWPPGWGPQAQGQPQMMPASGAMMHPHPGMLWPPGTPMPMMPATWPHPMAMPMPTPPGMPPPQAFATPAAPVAVLAVEETPAAVVVMEDDTLVAKAENSSCATAGEDANTLFVQPEEPQKEATRQAHATDRKAPAPSPAPAAWSALERTPAAPAYNGGMPASGLPKAGMEPSAAPGGAAPQSFWVRKWRQIGGGGLTLSLMVHAGLIVLAGFIVVVAQSGETPVDFLPGGGTSRGAQASSDLKHKVQQKQRKSLSKAMPKQRLQSTSMNAEVVLPDLPVDSLGVPDISSHFGKGSLGRSSGFGTAGAGSGFGTGFGAGSVKGFMGMTFFGKAGGGGMAGTFYDLKQNPQRKPTNYTDSEAAYAEIINDAAVKKFVPETMKNYYAASQKMSFTFLAIPNMAATEGPKAFAVEKEVEPRAWFVHYTATIEAPEPGEYRFVGFFDDALLVYINNKIVLDGSWYPIHDHGEKRRDADIRQDFGGPQVAANRHAYAGKWFKVSGPVRLDIVVGERPGGRVGGMLLVQNKKTKYPKRADETPILPVFSMIKPDMADMQRLASFKNGEVPFEVNPDIPVFKIHKSIFGD